MFWDLFQTYGYYGEQEMSTIMLAYVAIFVFTLMLVGLFLSAREFLKVSNDPSQVVGENSDLKKHKLNNKSKE